jgi:hypothetical protein
MIAEGPAPSRLLGSAGRDKDRERAQPRPLVAAALKLARQVRSDRRIADHPSRPNAGGHRMATDRRAAAQNTLQ